MDCTMDLNVTGSTNDGVTWKSSDTKVATVSKEGEVKAFKEGKATITATKAGQSDSCVVEIKDYAYLLGVLIIVICLENTLQLPFIA